MKYSILVFILLIICAVKVCYAEDESYEIGSSFRTLKSKQIINKTPQHDQSPPDTMPGSLAHQIYEKRYIENLTENDDERTGYSSGLSGQ